jgi:ABC-type transport system involved in cytochrome c biogenesis permease subunit
MKLWKKLTPWLVAAFCLYFVTAFVFEGEPKPGFALREFGRFPVLLNGRIKPLDTVARTSLLILCGKQSLRLDDGKSLSAIEWLTELMTRPELADDRKVFKITNPDTLGALGLQGEESKNYSFSQLVLRAQDVERQAELASNVEDQLRTPFQRDVVKLYERATLYFRLKNSLEVADTDDFQAEVEAYAKTVSLGLPLIKRARSSESAEPGSDVTQRFSFLAQSAYFFPIPPAGSNGKPEQWKKMGDSLLTATKDTGIPKPAMAYAAMATAYRKGDEAAFNSAVDEYRGWLQEHVGKIARTARLEAFFNSFAPFYKSMTLYVLVFILACGSWLAWPTTLGRYAFYLLIFSFAIHTAGLLFRIYLEGRPPVTNLYSSAVFIGWGAVLLGILLERFYHNGIGSATASILGFLTLLIAHHLSLDGDTMEMMRAVLDTNGWLATHVVCITLGYASTYLAGFLALIYIVRSVFTSSLDNETATSLSRMVYGIVCFATLFSFVGTILGGIWADQSWGRFWGWDPKENGALLIVLWNAIILHARWGGLVRQRGLMAMAVFGNIVTSWSWFGVNMLGIGLHSYGFMDKAFPWLIAFMMTQVVMMALAALPLKKPLPGK